MRIGFSTNAVPPPLEIVTERACANYPQTVLLPDVVDFNDSAHWGKVEIRRAES
jgi:hypothetical protein